MELAKMFKFSVIMLLVALACLKLWRMLPDEKLGLRFYLLEQNAGGLTLRNVHEAELLSVRIPSEPGNLTLVIHGYFGSVADPWLSPLAQEMALHRGGLVVAVDFFHLCSPSRPFMNLRIAAAAETLARIVGELVENRVTSLSQIHMVGFSMGNRILGGMSQHLGKVARITGIDPSYPWDNVVGAGPPTPSQFLDDDDAETVVYVKTSKISAKLGGAREIIFNGGIDQPGCENWYGIRMVSEFCSHYRAVDLSLEAIRSPAAAHRYAAYREGREVATPTSATVCGEGCQEVDFNLMADEIPPGIYHAETEESLPFLRLGKT